MLGNVRSRACLHDDTFNAVAQAQQTLITVQQKRQAFSSSETDLLCRTCISPGNFGENFGSGRSGLAVTHKHTPAAH